MMDRNVAQRVSELMTLMAQIIISRKALYVFVRNGDLLVIIGPNKKRNCTVGIHISQSPYI